VITIIQGTKAGKRRLEKALIEAERGHTEEFGSVGDLIKELVASGTGRPEDKKRTSLEGIFNDGRITDEDIEKAKKLWQLKTSR